MTSACSSSESVGASPVVPHATSADEPPATCFSTSAVNASRSMRPLRNGVTSATIEPSNISCTPLPRVMERQVFYRMRRPDPERAPRILSGRFRGRALLVPEGLVTRPVRALVRRSLFDSLQRDVVGKHWLDLFAGSGSFGIEALS